MQLTIRNLSKLRNGAEGAVSRWIKQRGLPAQQVGGQYRVNRAELLEWATANNILVSLELFDHLEADAETVLSLADALEIGGYHYSAHCIQQDQFTSASAQSVLSTSTQILDDYL